MVSPLPDPNDVAAAAREPEAIFIVGTGRSGTSLMRTLLERSPRIAIARESHYVGHLREREGARFYFHRVGDFEDDATMRGIVELIYSGEFARRSRWREPSTFWRWLVDHVPRDEMEQRLLAAERTERGLFVAFLRAYSDAVGGRPIIGEKTPAHLAYVATLLEWFPDARIVHMLRDPRAVYVSDLRRRRNKLRKPFSWIAKIPGALRLVILLNTSWGWRSAVRRHVRYEKAYPSRYRVLRFEDLVTKPDETLDAVYNFLGVEMPSDATDVKVVSQGFRAGEHGLDAGAADRWRQHVGRFEKRWLELVLRRQMQVAGYRQ
jgi:Sulfotransferase family